MSYSIKISNNISNGIDVYYPQHPDGIHRNPGQEVETTYTHRIFTFRKEGYIMNAMLWHGHYKVTNEGVFGGEKQVCCITLI